MLIDYDILERIIEVNAGNDENPKPVFFTVTPLSVDNYNRIATSKIFTDDAADPDRWMKTLGKVIKDHVKSIEGIEIKEKDQIRQAIPDDMTKHSGFYNVTMSLIGKMFEGGLDEQDRKNSLSPVESNSQQEG